MNLLKKVRVEVVTEHGAQVLEWDGGDALAKLMAEPVDLPTLVATAMREIDANTHLRQVDDARKASAK